PVEVDVVSARAQGEPAGGAALQARSPTRASPAQRRATDAPTASSSVAPPRRPPRPGDPTKRTPLRDAATAPPPTREYVDIVWTGEGVGPRTEIETLLTRAPRLDADEVVAAALAAIPPRGAFAPPRVIVAGGLHFPMDEVERLRALM